MAKATISSTVDYKIAKKLEDEANEKQTTVSQLIRDMLNEKYKINNVVIRSE